MRSRLEARVAALLDHYGLDWEYEPGAFASRRGQYLPDFLVKDTTFPLTIGADRKLYLEVKGALDKDQRAALEAQMEVVLMSEPQALLAYSTAEWLELGAWRLRWPTPPFAGIWTDALLLRCSNVKCRHALLCPVLRTTTSEQMALMACPKCHLIRVADAVEDDSIGRLPKYGEVA